jgi:hypothetical protein
MKGHAWDKTSIRSNWTWVKVIALVVLGFPLPAFAALGACEQWVQDDRVRLRVQLKTIAAGAYTIDELTSPLDHVDREYVSPTGIFFGRLVTGDFPRGHEDSSGKLLWAVLLGSEATAGDPSQAFPSRHHKPSLMVQSACHLRGCYGTSLQFPVAAHRSDCR